MNIDAASVIGLGLTVVTLVVLYKMVKILLHASVENEATDKMLVPYETTEFIGFKS